MSSMLDYFQRVVALSPGTYFSLHFRRPGGAAPGRAFTDFATAEQAALLWARTGHDVYLAMGAQKDCDPGGMAIRRIVNTVMARCLCMDFDVKANAYASTKEAMQAFVKFRKWVPLPLPTVVVLSGTGGFHVYDTLSELITPEEHHKLSSQLSSAAREFGLKLDFGCITDLVHLFRVPGTLNYKSTPPTPVALHHLGPEIDVNDMRAALARFVAAAPKSKPRISSDNNDLRGGVSYRRPTIEQVAEHCPFLKETLEEGGANLSGEPQWHDMAALSCHLVDPSLTIHRLCEKNEFYDYAKTEKKLAEAQGYRDQNPDLGPPRCATLKGNGASQCANCPHLALDTTPLAIPFTQTPKQVNGTAYFNDLPPGYFRDDQNRICLDEVLEKGDKPERVMVFPYALYPNSGYLEDGSPVRLTFMTRQGDLDVQMTFETSMVATSAKLKEALSARALIIHNEPKARGFFMHYIQLLQSRKETMIRVPPLGWSMQSGVMGFAYDGEFVTPQGKFPCQRPAKAIANYRVVGSDQVWREMAKLVLTPDRPDLMVLVATAFSAPLMRMCGQNGYLIGAHSTASGIGKTTALTLSQTAYGPPVLGGFTDTVNYTFSKCANLQDLPVIYDEVKGDTSADIVRLVLELTAGREKGRSDRTGQMKEIRTWHTNIPYATNNSVVAAVADQTQGTHASVYRIFEFEALDLPNKNLTTDMARLSTQLQDNYGGIGKIYATFLGQNYTKLRNKLLDYQIQLEQSLLAEQAERYWIAAMSTTLFGASLATSLGLAPFDVPVMKQFMIQEFLRMRGDKRMSSNDYTNPDALYNELSIVIAEKSQNVVITDRAWTARGRPTKDYAKILNDKVRWDEIGIQISGDPLTIRIRESFLTKWCKEHRKQKAALVDALIKFIGAKRATGRLASGTRLAGSDEWIVTIPVTGTPLEDKCEYAIQYKDLQP